MDWRRRATENELRKSCSATKSHSSPPFFFSLVPILVAAESFACESIIDALTIIENQCSIKTPLVLLQSATVESQI